MSDLAERLMAAIERDEKIADRAMQGRYRWAEAVGFITDDYTDDDLEAAELHASHHAPSIVLTHCGGHRAIVAEVQSWTHYYAEDSWYSCGLAVEPYDGIAGEPVSACANDDNRGRCTCGLDARRLRILSPLARGYGIQP